MAQATEQLHSQASGCSSAKRDSTLPSKFEIVSGEKVKPVEIFGITITLED